MPFGPVLIIDDDALTLKTLASILRLRQQLEVEVSDSTVGALERIRATDYAVLISDASQTRLSGPLFVRAVHKFRPETPVLLMLDQGTQVTAHAAIEAGAYDVLSKPIEAETLLLAVGRALEASELRRQVKDQGDRILAVLQEVMGNLEILYRAYGLRGHLEAIMAMAKAEGRFKASAQQHALTMVFPARGGLQAIAPQDHSLRLLSESGPA
jgi:two-component system, NtrC family, response regulator HydG